MPPLTFFFGFRALMLRRIYAEMPRHYFDDYASLLRFLRCYHAAA